MSKTPEGQILKAVLDYLAAEHILAFRMNTGAMSAEHNGKKRYMRFGVPGMADVLAFLPCRSVAQRADGRWTLRLHTIHWLEVKTEKGKQSEVQKSFQALVESHGHHYAVVRSVEDLKKVLK